MLGNLHFEFPLPSFSIDFSPSEKFFENSRTYERTSKVTYRGGTAPTYIFFAIFSNCLAIFYTWPCPKFLNQTLCCTVLDQGFICVISFKISFEGIPPVSKTLQFLTLAQRTWWRMSNSIGHFVEDPSFNLKHFSLDHFTGYPFELRTSLSLLGMGIVSGCHHGND